MMTIFKRELQGYFFTPLGYVFSGVFLSAGAFVFYVNNVLTRSGDLSGFFSMMGYLWMLLCPLLVMRLIAGERHHGTDALLLSAPVTVSSMVIGKYLAACAVLLLTSLLSMVYPLIIAMTGKLYIGETLTGYLGFLMMGCAFIAVDLTVSAFFSSPNSAMVFCIGANLLLWLVSLLAASVSGFARAIISLVSLYDRVSPFLYGQLSPANIVFFAAFSAACLAGCIYLLNAKNQGALS